MSRLRAALTTALVVGCAGAGLLAATSLASGATRAVFDTVTGTDTSTTDTSATTTTETATTETTATTTTPPTTPAGPPLLAEGVTVGGVQVGGMTRKDAIAAVNAAFAVPLPIVARGFRLTLKPAQVGARAKIRAAVAAAFKAPADTAVRLPVDVSSARVQRFVATIAARYDRMPVDSTVVLRKLEPFVSKGRPGRKLKRVAVRHAILVDLRGNHRAPVRLTGTETPQNVSRATFGPVIVIRNVGHTLTLYDGMHLVRRFGVATGQPAYPTPNGRFSIAVMWKNPWWYPPASPWAVGEKPVPPGPGNPLGTRWMGLTSPGVGIHGTPQPQSIGYSLSHGCIRMRIPDAEWLFDHVRVGATVFIVPA
jgi:lipoprotein-anchoring transpeptidase ErfK/SrfK